MYLVYLLLCAFGITVMVRVVRIQVIPKAEMKRQNLERKTDMREIEAARGNIYSDNKSLLAASIPYYEVRMDMKADGLNAGYFYDRIDSIAYGLANLFRDASGADYKRRLLEAHTNGNRYYLIKRKVKHPDMLELKKLPLFREGRNKSGLIITRENRRSRPYGLLAARTIGYERAEKGHANRITKVGIEGAYSTYLKGTNGRQLMQRVGSHWKPVGEKFDLMPQDGADVYTTLDINLQNVAENALLMQLQKFNAKEGCVVVMEVKTGYVKAIANLARNTETGEYYEDFNQAIGTAMEPGSTMKLASVIVALEDGKIKPADLINTGNGSYEYSDDFTMHDTKAHGTISFQQAFEQSSNIGISLPIYKAYKSKPSAFIEGLKRLGIHQPLGIAIQGEDLPLVKDPADRKHWSGISLPQISIGYEVKQTPLQTLALFNAVANNGTMVKPQFVYEIKKGNKVIEHYNPVVLYDKICSEKTLTTVRGFLQGVVERGTATNIKNETFTIAGKTGTAKIAKGKAGYYENKYYASFCGYFPADQPKYSCIVVVREPEGEIYYGAQVACPVFLEIAQKLYAKNLELHDYLNGPFSGRKEAPSLKPTLAADAKKLSSHLNYRYEMADEGAVWVNAEIKGKKINMKPLKNKEGLMPNAVGMGLRDALYLLENLGLKVTVRGSGKVIRQSIPAGTSFAKNNKVTIWLGR